MKKLGFIGCGNMGEAMLAGALKSGFAHPSEVVVHTKSVESRERLKKKYGIETAETNGEVVQDSEIIILGVKPNVYGEVIEETKREVLPNTIVIGIAPSFTLESLKELYGRDDIKFVRAMPNTPAMVGCGVTGISFGENLTSSEKEKVMNLFKSFGEGIEIKEELMIGVGSVSGSSPAFVYMMVEAMAEGAVLMGIPKREAYRFAAKAVEGAAKMVLESGKHPAELRDDVCSAGGTTIEGVVALEKNGFKGNIIEAMIKSAEKFQKMQDKN